VAKDVRTPSFLWEHSLLEQNCTTSVKHVCLKYTPGVVVSMVTRLRWTSQGSWFVSRQGYEIFFLLQSVETGSGAPPPHSLIKRLRGYLFPCVRSMGREFDHAPSSSTELKNEWSRTSTVPIRLHGVHSDNFTLSLTQGYKCNLTH